MSMSPVLTIARFELFYQLRQLTFWLFCALVFGQGIWYANQLTDLYGYTDPVTTSYLTLSSLGVLLAVAAVLMAGQSLTKDIDYQTASYLYALPITSRQHFTGRFVGTYVTTLVLAVFYVLGILVFYAFRGNKPFTLWIALVDGFVRLLVQNLFIVVSLTFSLTVLLRSIRGAYIALFLVVLYFLLTESGQAVTPASDLWQLMDPFGVSMARESVEAVPFSDASAILLTFSDMFFINRLLWLGLGLALLAYAESRFSFTSFGSNVSANLPNGQKVFISQTGLSEQTPLLLYVKNWSIRPILINSTKREFLMLIRQPVFMISLGLLVMLAILFSTVFDQNPDFPALPTTSRMTALRLPMGLFIGLFLLVMTVESFFRERTVGMWPIYDALPQSDFVLLLPRLLAMVGVAALLTFVLFLTGVSLQVSSGFREIDWDRYAVDLLTDGFLRYCQLIALSVCIASLTNNRLMSHLLTLLIFAGIVFKYQLAESDQSIWLYSFLPGSALYSDLVGYGSNTSLRPLVHLIWWWIAGLFLTSALLTWNRGVIVGFRERFRQWRTQFRWPYQLAFMAFVTLLGISIWQIWQVRSTSIGAHLANPLKTQTVRLPSVSGKTIAIQLHYYHPYQVRHMARAAARALRSGEQLFGAYPYTNLSITETPNGTADVSSKPGEILIAERQGWLADPHQPHQLDYIDYLVSREVFTQWLVHRLHPVHQAGDGFVRHSLAEYLALQDVASQYGAERLQQRLAQRASSYAKSRQRGREAEHPLLQSSGNKILERSRGALALTSIGQVWGDRPLSLTIGQFYRKAIHQPASATSVAFAQTLTKQLPDSLQYLQTYLSDRLWFDVKIGRVANLANGLTVEIIATKWRETGMGKRQILPYADYIPLVVFDQDGNPLYRQVVRPNSDQPFIFLPTLSKARSVVIDPLGAWPESNKRDNAKLL